MALENYRDLSAGGNDLSAGFQFEFFCAHCSRKWRSPFKPYRMGQLTGFLSRFAFLFSGLRDMGRASGSMADFGNRGAKEAALADAMRQAETMFSTCPVCKEGVCTDCRGERDACCAKCRADQGAPAASTGTSGASSSAATCPNCRTPGSGGRFCAECGFDMASTHKGCPSCGAMLARQARFCTDCGHSF